MDHGNASEDIASFLSRLRLPEQYITSFKENALLTVDDCTNLDEVKLKEMGITLPGHCRRILNKLPTKSSSERRANIAPAMDSLQPPATEEHYSGRASPGLQYLPLQTDSSAQARLEHRPLARNFSLPSSVFEREPRTSDSENTFDVNGLSKETPMSIAYRPLTPPPLDVWRDYDHTDAEYSKNSGEGDVYEIETSLLPAPPLNFPSTPPGEEEFPPPPECQPPIPSQCPPSRLDTFPITLESDPLPLTQEDQYLVSSKMPDPTKEDPYLVSFEMPSENNPYLEHSCSTNPSDDYNFLSENCNIVKRVPSSTKTAFDYEDDYDHLKGNTSINSRIPQSPKTISSAVATLFNHSSPLSENEERCDGGSLQSEYDRLNANIPPSTRKEISSTLSTSVHTPPHSLSPSRSHLVEIADGVDERSILTRTYSGETAKNMPLPPTPWKAVVEDNSTASFLPVVTTLTEKHLTSMHVTPAQNDEVDYWARGAEGEEKGGEESKYDVLSVSRQGHTNYTNKEMLKRNQSIQIDLESHGESSEYETVEFDSRKPFNSTLDSLSDLPPVPHNTPLHAIEQQEDLHSSEQHGSYEEVEFPAKYTTNYPDLTETAIYSGVDDQDGSSLNILNQKNKRNPGVRRLTGVQAHLQKASQSAKAVVKRKPKRRAKLESTQSISLSDNEVEDYSSCQTSTNKSLEDLTKVPNLPPNHPSHHPKELSDSYSGGFTARDNSNDFRASRLSRTSPVSRRKRADAQSSSSIGLDNVHERSSIDDGIYEDISATIQYDASYTTTETTQSLLEQKKESKRRPIKAPRQRPVSVFMDASKSPQDVLLPGNDERTRTYSATLKHGLSGSTSAFPDEYMDVHEFLKSYQSAGPVVVPVSPLTKKRTKSGWLWKHGGHEGRAPLRKRWAVFDGEELAYYENDSKTDFSKGILPTEVMLRLQVPQNSQTIFHLQMKGGRTFIFQAESSDERTMWTSTIMAAILTLQQKGAHQHKPGGNMFMPYKEGALKMEGIRQKVYLATKGDQAAYYKSKNEFLFAQPIARLQMKLATVKEAGNRKFQVVFPYRTFTFTAESEEEKRSWMEPLQDAIAEGLSDYQVLREIWFNESNKKCADCGRSLPDWASINLAIIICKHCAGVHRELGVHNSKVRSLKMDIRIWDATMKRLLIDIGNEEANRFWAADLSSSEEITDMADKNQRAWFIKSKYIDMDYVSDRREGVNQTRLNQSLVEAVKKDNLIDAYQLTFSGADINCNTGKEYARTPQLLAEYLTYTTLAEFLRQNGGTDINSPEGHITDRNTSVRKKNSIPKTRTRPPVCLKDCLFKYGGDFKNTGEDSRNRGRLNIIRSALQPGDFQKRLCVLENSTLKYCDPEKPSVVKDSLSCSDLISITVHAPEQAVKAGYQHCFELSRNSGRTYLFCAEKEDTRMRWTRGIMQEIVPSYIQDAMQSEQEYERIGKVRIKAKSWSKSDSPWSTTWCRLHKKKLQYYHNESRAMETIDLRKLVQIAVDQTRETISSSSNGIQAKESIPTIMLVFRDKSYFIRSDTRPDTESWMAAIRRADNESGPKLDEKQLTTEGVPIVLEKCITYVEQFGITTRGIYRLSGTHSKTTQLLSDFHQNAREAQMREGHMNVHDVANALKRWFKSLPGSLLTEQLHNQWIETAQYRPEHHNRKLEWYKHLIEQLPEINKVTLKVLLNHLINVSSHEKENEMSAHNLAIVFGPTLMEPQDEDEESDKYLGQTSQEIACIEDLLQYYDWLFDVTDTDREKEQRMQLAKEKIHQAKQQQNMITTMDYDMMVPIYINRKEDRCVNYKVNISAGELITKVCKAHGYPPEKWALYEVILDGDAERPLHFSEHVLSVIKSWQMPSTNYLLAKNDYVRDKMRWFKQYAANEGETIMEGHLRFCEGKRKWSKVTGCLARRPSDGDIHFKYFKNASDSDVRELVEAHRRKRSIRTRAKMIGWSKFGNLTDNASKPAVTMSISSLNIYIGVDKKSKPPGNGKQAFTIHQVGESPKFFVAETEGELYRWVSHFLLNIHPEGFTPPATQESSPAKSLDDSSEGRGHSDARISPYGTVSQQELGAQIAARVVNLQRTSSNESTGSVRERFLEHGQGTVPTSQGGITPSRITSEAHILEESEIALEDVYDMHQPIQPIAESSDFPTRPQHLPADIPSRRTTLHHSPVDPRNQQRAGLGIQLQDELSSVLRRKRPQ